MFKMIKKDIDGLKNTLIEDIDKMKDRVDSLFKQTTWPTTYFGGSSMSNSTPLSGVIPNKARIQPATAITRHLDY